MTFLTSHSDRLIFGKMIPTEMLGVYSIGATLAGIPSAALSHLGGTIFFPVYAKILNDKGELAPIYRRTRWALLVVGGWALSGFVAGGQVVVDILYDERYRGAGWIVQFLSAAGWFVILESTAGVALLALGRASWVAGMSGAKLAGMLIMIPLGFLIGGFPGAVIGYAASEVMRYLVSASGTARSGLGDFGRDLVLTTWVAASSILGYFAGHWVSGASGPVAAAAVVFVIVTASWAPFVRVALREYRSARG
jgi:O-antigen/teichoic acid export membrane protein